VTVSPEIESTNNRHVRLASALFLGVVSVPIANWLFDWGLLGQYDKAAIAVSFWLGYFCLFPVLQEPDGFRALRRVYGPIHWYAIVGLPVLLLMPENVRRQLPAFVWVLLYVFPVAVALVVRYVAGRFNRSEG
jgi:hypothetical protein